MKCARMPGPFRGLEAEAGLTERHAYGCGSFEPVKGPDIAVRTGVEYHGSNRSRDRISLFKRREGIRGQGRQAFHPVLRLSGFKLRRQKTAASGKNFLRFFPFGGCKGSEKGHIDSRPLKFAAIRPVRLPEPPMGTAPGPVCRGPKTICFDPVPASPAGTAPIATLNGVQTAGAG